MKLLINEYLDSIIDDIGILEELVLNWEHGNLDESGRNKILRIVHSLKGSSGSYGFRQVSRLCHSFEDDFIRMTKQEGPFDTDKLLRVVDQFKKFVETGQDIEPDGDEQQEVTVEGDRQRVLLVSDSGIDMKVLDHSLKALNVEMKRERDALNAIDVILTRRFDVIILSTTMTGMDGLSLLKTIKVIDSPNKDSKLAMLSTRSHLELDSMFEPDVHIVKDETITSRIDEILRNLLGQGDSFPYQHVVYVDDTRSLHALVKMALKKVDCRLDCFDQAEQAIAYINQHKPDLVLCDFNLDEGVTGAQVFKRLEYRPKHFIFLTGEEESEHAKMREETPQVTGIISKPISPKSLVAKILQFQ